jgi:hypothetical protein
VATVPLSRGLVAQVDEEDLDWLSEYSWNAERKAGPNGVTYYARRSVGAGHRKQTVRMHRQIAEHHGLVATTHPGRRPTTIVDHFDGDGLNNCKSNFRIVTPAGNARNRSPARVKGRFRGVFKHKLADRFEAALGCGPRKPNGKAARVSLGLWVTEEEAAVAVDLKLDALGWQTPRNFPDTESALQTLFAIEARRILRCAPAPASMPVQLRRDIEKIRGLIERLLAKEAA